MPQQRRDFEIDDIVMFSDAAFRPLAGVDRAGTLTLRELYRDVRLRVVNVRKAQFDPFMPNRKQLLRVDPVDARLARSTFWVDNRRCSVWWDDYKFRLAGAQPVAIT
jgi:Xaa-Pro aminopeptidase